MLPMTSELVMKASRQAADVTGNVINDSDTKSRPKPKNLGKVVETNK